MIRAFMFNMKERKKAKQRYQQWAKSNFSDERYRPQKAVCVILKKPRTRLGKVVMNLVTKDLVVKSGTLKKGVLTIDSESLKFI